MYPVAQIMVWMVSWVLLNDRYPVVGYFVHELRFCAISKLKVNLRDVKMAAVHGVETNEASRYADLWWYPSLVKKLINYSFRVLFRFIDHTLATPWETLVSDLESALRTLFKSGQSEAKVDIYYQGLTYKLEKRKSALLKKDMKSNAKGDLSRDFKWLQTTYSINWFFLLSHSAQSNDYNLSHRTTLLSAFVTAVKSVGGAGQLSLPVFFTYSYVTDISKTRDLIGYQVLPHSAGYTKLEDGTPVRWCRYETHCCAQAHMKAQFAFYDGLRMIFQNQLSALHLAGKNAETFYIETDVSYKHQQNTLYGLLGTDVSSKKESRTPVNATPFSANFIKRLTALVPADEVNVTLLSELHVDLTYRAQPQNSIIDNHNFTTFVPSKLPPHCWSVHTDFKTQPFKAPAGGVLPTAHKAYLAGFNNFGTEYALSSTWMCQCVRKLLAFYLLSVYCGKRKINIETMSAEIEATENLLDKNILDRIVEVLSDESKEVFYTVCRQQIDSKLSPNAGAGGLTPPLGKQGSVDHTNAVKSKSAVKEAFPTPAAGEKSPTKASRNNSPLPTPVSSISSSIAPGALSNVSANLFGGGEDDWNLRSDRHRSVIEDLFSGESIYDLGDLGKDTTQALALDVPLSSSVGLWMGLFSILCASASVDAHDMATIWSKCMRKVHIAWEDGQLLPTFVPPQASPDSTPTSSTRSDGDTDIPAVHVGNACRADRKIPICQRTLWGDAIDRRHDEELQSALRSRNLLNLSWPDQTESLVVQKLQQLQFCISMQNESAVYNFAGSTVAIQVTGSSIATNTAAVEVDASVDAPQASADTPQLPGATETTTLATTTVTQPSLFRRLPLTEDMISMNKYLSKKVSASNSRSNRAHPTLKVQLQIPSILSDMKAFKAANTGVDLLVFCQWYGVTPVSSQHTEPIAATSNPLDGQEDNTSGTATPLPTEGISPECSTKSATKPVLAPHKPDDTFLKVSLEELTKAWDCCEAQACEDQGKPLFQVEKEAEKAMAYLESVPASELASEMVVSGIRLLYGILSKQMEPWILESCQHSTEDAHESAEEGASPTHDTRRAALAALKTTLRGDLVLLKEQVENAVQSLQPPKIVDPTSPKMQGDNDINIATLILVDSVAGLMQKLETMLVKLQALSALVQATKTADAQHLAETMIYSLARRDTCTAETGAEMSVLYELSKALRNHKQNQHDWHSSDGRELGQASSKTFACKLVQPRYADTASKDTPASQPDSVSTQAITAATGTVSAPTSTALTSASTLLDVFQMEATVEQDFLRLSFRVPEDGY